MKLQDKVQLQEIHLWTVEDYHHIMANGLLAEDDHVELIEGIVSHISPKGIAHIVVGRWIAEQLREKLPDNVYMLTQDPITLREQHSEPEPDITIAKGAIFDYLNHHPYPEDIWLVIEVADTSLNVDKKIKMPIYAQAGIGEYWVVDIRAKEITVFCQPIQDSYEQVQVLRGKDKISPQAFPKISFRVEDLFLEGASSWF